jgi:inorganic pyrophosphatase
MDIKKIPIGKNPPEDFNVIIEVSAGTNPVKYEFDKDLGIIAVDRFLFTAMFYPCNYGFIPNTLSGDGDPVDVLVVTQYPLQSGVLIKCRPVGVLIMKDESGQDEKILAVPVPKLTAFYDNIKDYQDFPKIFLDQIAHFFARYKDLEKGKFVEVVGWKDIETAKKAIKEGIKNAK